ncbi:uncharacterized protein LOC131396453 isoform X1 [Diceros bicornis minor]|uniref:uncharacterized protein LOC131396453 isoform X1 n=1 Tax=Diceros bicornis minor TaxID=77932 RepID=UPI0026EFC3E4|nr:uncharacterized protein LOC131396453 isoform X1 [Diceros bicornis minor]
MDTWVTTRPCPGRAPRSRSHCILRGPRMRRTGAQSGRGAGELESCVTRAPEAGSLVRRWRLRWFVCGDWQFLDPSSRIFSAVELSFLQCGGALGRRRRQESAPEFQPAAEAELWAVVEVELAPAPLTPHPLALEPVSPLPAVLEVEQGPTWAPVGVGAAELESPGPSFLVGSPSPPVAKKCEKKPNLRPSLLSWWWSS